MNVWLINKSAAIKVIFYTVKLDLRLAKIKKGNGNVRIE